DFAPIALLGRAADVMVVHPRNIASSPNEIVAAAKSRPGALTFASGGSGTSHHLAGVLFGRLTGIDIVHVPYKSAEQGVRAARTTATTGAKLKQEMNKIFASAETKQKLGSLGFELSAPLTPDAFRQVIADDFARWVPLVKAFGAKAE